MNATEIAAYKAGRDAGHCNCLQRGVSKLWLQAVAANLLAIGFFARLRAALENRIPLGYQDERGFHFGIKTKE